jgi:DNA-binding transcriptional LysR family regulator
MNSLKDIDLNLLRAFEALWTERSVSAAARRLRLGQPATSAALARLRAAFGDELFVRVGAVMQPTLRATALATPILTALGELRAGFETPVFDPATAIAAFTVAQTDYTALVTLPAALAHVRSSAPDVGLHIVGYDKDDIVASIETGDVDLAIGVFPDAPQRLRTCALFEDSFVGVADRNHSLFRAPRLRAEDYATLKHALVTVRRDTTGYIDKRLAELDLSRNVTLTAPFLFALGSSLRGADLVAAIPRRAAAVLAAQGLRTFELPFETEPWTVSMIWSQVADADPAHSWLRGLWRDQRLLAPRA